METDSKIKPNTSCYCTGACIVDRLLEELHLLTIRVAKEGIGDRTEQLDRLIDLRDQVLFGLAQSPELTNQQRGLLREVSRYDQTIVQQMQLAKFQAAEAIKKLNQSKVQKNVYETGYNAGGHFIDHKK